MSRIGWAIRDTMSIENDAPRVNVWERGRPSFQLLLNARAPNPGHSYLRLLRRKCLLPSAPRVRLRTLNRTSYESRNAMTNEPTAARAASALRNFSIWGPPIESSAARARDASQGHFTANARTHVWQTQFLQTFVRVPYARSFGQWGLSCVIKKTGQTPAWSLPRKENGKARTSMDEKSVRKSHGHHIPPAKGMGE